MSSNLRLVAGLLALERGRAVPFASHLQVAIQPHALIVCPLAMAGEDTTVHAIAIGQLGRAPKVYSVADPRFRDDQYALFRHLGQWITRYFAWCRERNDYPQIWVSSGAGAAHLDILADRLRYNRRDAEVRWFGTLLSHATERHPTAGQQALVVATEVLRAHFATGQQASEDAHLGALHAWITPPSGLCIQDAVAVAEQTPMGVKTDPVFDRKTLAPLVGRWNRARRDENAPEMQRFTDLIYEALAPVATAIYRATERAVQILQGLGLESLPDLEAMEERERYDFANFMRHVEGGGFLPLRDGARRAAFGLVRREDAVENTTAATVLGDRVARAQARLAGSVIRGRVENPRSQRVGRRTDITFELLSDQPIARARRRDTMCWCDDPRLKVEVLDVRREGPQTRLFLSVTNGKRVPGAPSAGAELELAPKVPNWRWIGLQMQQLSSRIENTPWTHDNAGVPGAAPTGAIPTDPLADVESLR